MGARSGLELPGRVDDQQAAPVQPRRIHRLPQHELGGVIDVPDAGLLDRGVEGAHRGAVLDGIPGGIHAGGEARMGGPQPRGQAVEFVRRFVGRIDQDQAPPLGAAEAGRSTPRSRRDGAH